MIKRYMTTKWMVPADGGGWVAYGDHEAEVARLREQLAAKDKLIAEQTERLERKSIVLKAAGKAFNESAVVKDNAHLRRNVEELRDTLVLAEATLEALGRADVADMVTAALRKWPREEVDKARLAISSPNPTADFTQKVSALAALAENTPPEMRATSAVREAILGDVKEPG